MTWFGKKLMEQKQEQLVEILNDLVRINNDRIEGYEKAIEELEDTDLDLQEMFRAHASSSREYVRELSLVIHRLGGTVATSTTTSGKIYRTWMDIKSAFTGDSKTRLSVLESCEYGEDAALSAYESALGDEYLYDAPARELITSQRNAIQDAHDTVKRHRDLQRTIA